MDRGEPQREGEHDRPPSQATHHRAGLNLLDKDDAGRGALRGKSYVKHDYVRALLAHQATVRAAGGAGAAGDAGSPPFAVNDIVQINTAGAWQLATISAIGDLAGSAVYTLR